MHGGLVSRTKIIRSVAGAPSSVCTFGEKMVFHLCRHLVAEVAHSNVKLQIKQLLAKSPVLREMATKGEIKAVGARHDVETGAGEFD